MESLDYTVVRRIHGKITSRTVKNSNLSYPVYILHKN